MQLLATWGVWPGAPDDLRFRPDDPADPDALRRELGASAALLAQLPPARPAARSRASSMNGCAAEFV